MYEVHNKNGRSMIFNLDVITWRKHQCRRDTQRHQEWPNPAALMCVIGSEPPMPWGASRHTCVGAVSHPCMRDSTCSPKPPVPHLNPAILEQSCHATQPHGTRKKTLKSLKRMKANNMKPIFLQIFYVDSATVDFVIKTQHLGSTSMAARTRLCYSNVWNFVRVE
ncbi:hypothetical protein PIB30_026445 [Stylosanthes scabra]|uniref:Uncharacterized protein n=1 Tax=Stylosanthes scabra TaxID=79078 RepID=A0ABU6U9V2_9FABA|nr:hypothetical protein [Stylosanthes scabra]